MSHPKREDMIKLLQNKAREQLEVCHVPISPLVTRWISTWPVVSRMSMMKPPSLAPALDSDDATSDTAAVGGFFSMQVGCALFQIF